MSGGSGYAGRVAIDGAASSAGPLPSGAATEATLATLATEATLASIDAKTPTFWNPATCSQSN